MVLFIFIHNVTEFSRVEIGKTVFFMKNKILNETHSDDYRK